MTTPTLTRSSGIRERVALGAAAYDALTTVLRPASVLPGDDPAAPDYDDGWWGFVSKDLRGRWSRRYCGKGNRTKCRVALQASLRQALATVDPATLYGPLTPLGPRNATLGQGAIRAFGGHKGSGLALMCELLGGSLTGNRATGPNQRFSNGMFSIYVDPARVDPSPTLFERAKAEFERWRARA